MNEEKKRSFRIFCAIELPVEIRAKIEKHIQALRKAVPECHASWSRVENIHLTIKFFGNVEQDRIQLISSVATRVVREFRPFEISVGQTGVFPKLSQPRVLWIGVKDTKGMLAELQQRFEDECAAIGFEKEVREFKPHLTVARTRKPEGARALAEANQMMGFASETFLVNELVVFRSEPGGQGSKYTAMSRHKF